MICKFYIYNVIGINCNLLDFEGFTSNWDFLLSYITYVFKGISFFFCYKFRYTFNQCDCQVQCFAHSSTYLTLSMTFYQNLLDWLRSRHKNHNSLTMESLNLNVVWDCVNSVPTCENHPAIPTHTSIHYAVLSTT